MRQNWRHIMTVLGFAACVAMIAPSAGCVVRARTRPIYVVESEPPAPQYVHHAPRAGYVWVQGHWQMVGGRWRWKGGHWVKARSGYSWTAGHWEKRGNRYHWIEGRWVAGAAPAPNVRDHRKPAPAPAPAPAPNVRDHRDAAPPAYPTAAPPAPRYANPGAKAGYVWIRGHYEWNGRWEWQNGHWEREKKGKVWRAGVWEKRGNRYVWVEGGWVAAPAQPKVRDHRDKKSPPPPARKNQRVPAKRGGN